MSDAGETTLVDLIELAMTKHDVDSTNKLAKRAKALGYTIVNTTLSGLRAGTYRGVPRRKTLEDIAGLAGVSYETAERAAGVKPAGPPFHEEFTDPEFDELTRSQREVVKVVARALLKANQAGSVNKGIERPNLNPGRVTEVGHTIAYVNDEDLAPPEGLTPTEESM